MLNDIKNDNVQWVLLLSIQLAHLAPFRHLVPKSVFLFVILLSLEKDLREKPNSFVTNQFCALWMIVLPRFPDAANKKQAVLDMPLRPPCTGTNWST